MEYIEQHQGSNRAILVSVSVQLLDDLDVEEFRLLAQSAGAEILEHITAQRIKPDPKLFIGSGKAEEIAELAKALEADLVIFDHALSPSQERNLERVSQSTQSQNLNLCDIAFSIYKSRIFFFSFKRPLK